MRGTYKPACMMQGQLRPTLLVVISILPLCHCFEVYGIEKLSFCLICSTSKIHKPSQLGLVELVIIVLFAIHV